MIIKQDARHVMEKEIADEENPRKHKKIQEGQDKDSAVRMKPQKEDTRSGGLIIALFRNRTQQCYCLEAALDVVHDL